MPLQKILLKPGVNRENTRYTNEGGWFESDKVRFRQGTPEMIGGWQRISSFTFLGVCRSLWNWVTLGNLNLIGVGTNLKFYISNGGAYYDVTPIRASSTINNNPFALTASTTVTVTDTSHGCTNGSFVTFSGATDIGGVGTNVTAAVLNQEFQITLINANSYSITISVTPNATALASSPGGGAAVVAAYQVNAGPEYAVPLVGWGSGAWGSGTWSNSSSSVSSMQIWNQINYGQDLLYGPRGGGLYYWSATSGLTVRGKALNTLGGGASFTAASPTVVTSTVLYTEGAKLQFGLDPAIPGATMPSGVTAGVDYYVFNVDGLQFNIIDVAGNLIAAATTGSGVIVANIVDVPLFQNALTVSDASRFTIVFGTNDYGSLTLDPMLIRWSNQEDVYNWTPTATNQAGSIRLSHGSQIITAVQTRQEIVVFTDASVYSMQYLGPPYVWQTQLLGDNISIASPSAAIVASGVIYWMGVDKFYMYDGRTQTLNCDLRKYVFSDINLGQSEQIFCGTNEGFNEVWWFYPSANSFTVDKYVVYNYVEQVWYYGTMARTAWCDSGLRDYPFAATYINNLVNHEQGLNDNMTATTAPIEAYISSSEFDIGDGHNFGFVWRVLPDLTFNDSSADPTTGDPAAVQLTLYGLANSGSGATSTAGAPVSKISTYNVTEEFTGQVFTRMRGRQIIFKISSNQINTSWQLGAPRIDIRPDGRR